MMKIGKFCDETLKRLRLSKKGYSEILVFTIRGYFFTLHAFWKTTNFQMLFSQNLFFAIHATLSEHRLL